MKLGLAFITASLLASVAAAQPPPPPPDSSVEPAQTSTGVVLPNMLPSRYGGTLDVRTDYTHSNGGLLGDDVLMLGLNLYGSYIWPQNYGAYITVPYYYASADETSENGLGNIELGGLYKLPQGATSEILLRGGIAIDTAGQIDAFLAPSSQIGPRLYDAYTTGFSTNWLKLEGSYRHSSGNLRLGLSAAADVPFAGDDGELTFDVDALAKAAASIGVENGDGVGFGVGLAMLYAVGGDDDDNAIFGLNATLNIPVSPAMTVYGAFGLPDLEHADELDIFAFGAGLRAAIN